MIEGHDHNGLNSTRVDVRNLAGPSVYTDDLAVSAQLLGTILQRGGYTLAAGVKFVAFPRQYSGTTNLQVLLTGKTNNPQFLESVAVSGFTVSGSGTDTGIWLAIGYK